MSFNFDPPGKNNPADMRNMIIFIVAALALWFAFDHFIMKPRSAAMQQAKTVSATAPAPEPPRARADILEDGERIQIDSAKVLASIPTTGIRIDDLTFKDYYTTLEKTENVTLFNPAGTEHPHYAEIGWLSDDTKVPDKSTVWEIEKRGDATAQNPIVMTWSNGEGVTFERRISLDSNYLFEITQRVINESGKPVIVYPYGALARRVPPEHGKGVGYEGPLGFMADEMQEVSYGKIVKKGDVSFPSEKGWIGFGDKYWISSLLPTQTGNHTFRFHSEPAADPKQTLYQVDVRGEAISVAAGASTESVMHLYAGVKKADLLEEYQDKLGVENFKLAVDFGSLWFLTEPLYFLLNLFNSWTHNFGIAILLLTLTVRLAVFPLANTSYRSFAQLKKISPRMAELKIKYGDDKPRLQKELIKLYETERVNPMAGCFPLLLQIPIFFAVYKVISISIEMRHAPFFGWIQDLSARDPLSVTNLFGLLPFEPPSLLMIGPWSVAMFVLMVIQKNLNPPPQDKIQQDIAFWMPWVMTFTLASFPSGLVIYWTFSNLVSVIQQYVIMRMMKVPVYLLSPSKAREYEASHAVKVAEASEKAKAEMEEIKAKSLTKKNEPVKESLFDDSKPAS